MDLTPSEREALGVDVSPVRPPSWSSSTTTSPKKRRMATGRKKRKEIGARRRRPALARLGVAKKKKDGSARAAAARDVEEDEIEFVDDDDDFVDERPDSLSWRTARKRRRRRGSALRNMPPDAWADLMSKFGARLSSSSSSSSSAASPPTTTMTTGRGDDGKCWFDLERAGRRETPPKEVTSQDAKVADGAREAPTASTRQKNPSPSPAGNDSSDAQTAIPNGTTANQESTTKKKEKNNQQQTPPATQTSKRPLDARAHACDQERKESNPSPAGNEPSAAWPSVLDGNVASQDTAMKKYIERAFATETAKNRALKPKASSPSSVSAARTSIPNGNTTNRGNATTKKNMKKTTSAAGMSSMKMTARTYLKGAIPDLKESGALDVGELVYAAWSKTRNKPPYYYPGVVRSVSMEMKEGRQGGTSVLYDVLFDDGDRLDGIEEGLVIPRRKYLEHNLKPLLRVGERVCSAWWEDDDRSIPATKWYPGVIRGCKESQFGGPYGPMRFYDVQFDDGDKLDSIEDYFVMRNDDYLLSIRNPVRGDIVGDGDAEEWIGVKNRLDKQSVDEYFKEVGWYVATIDGKEQSFSFLSDALRAYDDHIVGCKSNKTKKSDINLLEEWAFPTPLGICPPVRVKFSTSTCSSQMHGPTHDASSKEQVDDEANSHSSKQRVVSPNSGKQTSSTHRKRERGEMLCNAQGNSRGFCRPHIKELRTTPKTNHNHYSTTSEAPTAISSKAISPEIYPVDGHSGKSVNLDCADTEPEPLLTSDDSDNTTKMRPKEVNQAMSALGGTRSTIDDNSNFIDLTNPKTVSKSVVNNVTDAIIDAPCTLSSKMTPKPGRKTWNHITLSAKESKIPGTQAEGLPKNWKTRKIPRPNVPTNTHGKRAHDTYYYSPKMGYKFRSKQSVDRFLACLKRSSGDEALASQEFRTLCQKRTAKESLPTRNMQTLHASSKANRLTPPQSHPSSNVCNNSSASHVVHHDSRKKNNSASFGNEDNHAMAVLGDTRSTTKAITDPIDLTNLENGLLIKDASSTTIGAPPPAGAAKITRRESASSSCSHPTVSANESKFLLPLEGFPQNWTVRRIPRNKGKNDYFQYYSPGMKYKFRSKLQVGRFLECLERTGGDEALAIEEFHGSAQCSKKKSIISKTTSTPLYKVVEFVEPSKTLIEKKEKENCKKEGGGKAEKKETTPKLEANGYVKPVIKKGEKVYACWSGGGGQDWFPGRVWEIKESPGAGYGPKMKYDIVFDDGDTEQNVGEIWIAKKADYEVCLQKPEESDWIGVNNTRFPDSEDEYARMIGWYETCLEGVKKAYSSLGEAMRAYDKHIVETRGSGNIAVTDLNFPEEHCA